MWRWLLVLGCVAQDILPFYFEVEDPGVGLLQPLASEELSNFSLWDAGIDAVWLELQIQKPPKASAETPQALLALTENGRGVFRLQLSQAEQSTVQSGEEALLTLGSSGLPSLCTLKLSITNQVDLSINEQLVASVQLRAELPKLQLHLGKALRDDEVDFQGHIFQVKLWRSHRGETPQDAPALHLQRAHGCPALLSETSPWSKLREKAMQVLQCALSSSCSLKAAPVRYLVSLSDEVLDREMSQYSQVSQQCPLGFALAYAALFFTSYLETEDDAALAFSNLKLGTQVLSKSIDVFETSRYEPMFGGSRPLRWLKLFAVHARRRLRDIIDMPSEGAPSSNLWSGNHSRLQLEDSRHALASRLCIEILHDGTGDSRLPLLRNAVESLATAGLTDVFLVIRLTAGCGGPWSDPQSPEGWYLAWLQDRFLSGVACKDEAHNRGGRHFVLLLPSNWHLLPFPPQTVWSRINEAAELLEGSPGVVAVSMREKFKQGFFGQGAPLRRRTDVRSLKSFLLLAPALSPDWNLTEAERLLTDIYHMFAARAEPAPLLEPLLQDVHPCGSAMLCAPGAWWKEDLESLDSGQDVWLLRSRESRGPGDDEVVALSRGLFQPSQGTRYEYFASARNALGIPPCVSCHLQSLPGQEPAAKQKFTLYFTVVDVIGVCREQFGNLFYDALEALQIASFQGPDVVLVEPLISNGVRRVLTEKEAAEYQKDSKNPGVFSLFREAGMCTPQYEGTTSFGDVFDWPQLVQWLQQARGIRGQISWKDWKEKTGGTVDMLAMQAEHWDGNERLPCADSEEEMTLRFYLDHLHVRKRVCVQSRKHGQGFELRFLDGERLEDVILNAVSTAKAAGKSFTTVGLYLFWIEGAERARLHPARYGPLSSHVFYTSIWRGLQFSQKTLQRAARAARQLGLLVGRGRPEGTTAWRPFMAAHWRQGDLYANPAARKAVQVEKAKVENFGPLLGRLLRERGLSRLFLMTNARSEVMKKLREELIGVEIFQAPLMRGHENAQRQLCVEMAIASFAQFFLAFGDGIVQGHVSKPSLLTMQMRLHSGGLAVENNGFAFAESEIFAEDLLGL
eukprot:s2092_g4.t3